MHGLLLVLNILEFYLVFSLEKQFFHNLKRPLTSSGERAFIGMAFHADTQTLFWLKMLQWINTGSVLPIQYH